ncbi:meprin A subunit beta [Misgurnus anguillicaudatus]|uniref:meprin A subunit beta n=1 Tax=Misgurnus anguillicaudatus TaxID=75329 RepID=UPI003CCFD89A
MVPEERSIILGNQYRWQIPVPYVLSSNLDINYKGVILRAFERFRLKSCVDFKPRTTEDYYISVEYLEGCWSFVGRTPSPGQTVSIGDGCGTIGIVEHEFLHALGFYHEQSRYDRDDHVTIKFENVIAGSLLSLHSLFSGHEENFDKYDKSVTNLEVTPYDYMSVMHYDKNAFSNGNGSTIITKRPEFQDLIGQRMDMSEYDAIELNKLYKCNSSTSFLDHCSFDDDSLCQMNVCSSTQPGWQRVSSVTGVNVTDHTYLGKEANGTSFFMHFSLVGRNEGDSARLESRAMTPTRDCKVQCVQFYYFHSGNVNDQLNIWIREYQDAADSTGTLRLMEQITGTPDYYWRLHHVTLNAYKNFQVVFEARKGAGDSSGGFSLDDINISQTECPKIWQIRNIEKLLNTRFTKASSPLYYSSEGYRYQVFLDNYSYYIYLRFRLISGEFDKQLQWPCAWRQVTFQILDQNPHIQKRMSIEQSFTTDLSLTSDNMYVWDNPRNNGTLTIIGNETVYASPKISRYFNKSDFSKRDFIKGGDFIVLISMQDISGLLQKNSVPCPNGNVKNIIATPNESARQGPWIFGSSVRTLPSSLIVLLVLCLFLLKQ